MYVEWDVAIVGILIVVAYSAGNWMAGWMYHDILRDWEQVRADRRQLNEENKGLRDEIDQLKRRMIEMESRLAAALSEIDRLSSAAAEV